eukprot:Rhum_TRINITY_DN1429_c0_g1::Rhum_TRINITY_DN1429_c0_g1_i1::g.4092::m.4092
MGDGALGPCSVCLVGLLSGEDTVATTPCGHMYHYKCILQSLQFKETCPNCCAKLEEGSLHRLAPSYVGGKQMLGEGVSQEDSHDAHALQEKLKAATEHSRYLSAENKRLKGLQSKQITDIAALRKEVTTLTAQQQTVAREKAKLWDDAAVQRRELKKLQEQVAASGLLKKATSQGFATASDAILTAAPEVKNLYIQELQLIIAREKELTQTLNRKVASLSERDMLKKRLALAPAPRTFSQSASIPAKRLKLETHSPPASAPATATDVAAYEFSTTLGRPKAKLRTRVRTPPAPLVPVATHVSQNSPGQLGQQAYTLSQGSSVSPDSVSSRASDRMRWNPVPRTHTPSSASPARRRQNIEFGTRRTTQSSAPKQPIHSHVSHSIVID